MKASSNNSKDLQKIGPTSDIPSNLSEDLRKEFEFYSNANKETKDCASGLFDKMLKDQGKAS